MKRIKSSLSRACKKPLLSEAAGSPWVHDYRSTERAWNTKQTNESGVGSHTATNQQRATLVRDETLACNEEKKLELRGG